MNAARFLPVHVLAGLACAFTLCTSHAETVPDKPVVKGKFLGDGKDGNLQFLVVQTREPFSGQPAIKLVFTEKNPAASKKPDFDAGFKKLGSALILSVHKDGGIFGCEVAHSAHAKSPFSAVGTIKIADFKAADGIVSGRVTTGGETDAFGQKWEVDLTFSAPLPKGAFAAAVDEEAMPKKNGKEPGDAPPAAPATPAGPKLPIAKLPLPAGALDVEYKKVVEQIAFRSDASVSAVAADFSAKLKQQGWTDASGGLTTKTNAILKRKLNGADLTIMVKSAAKGCTVTIFTQGMDWTNPPASAAATPNTERPLKIPDPDEIESEAKRQLEDALKKIPGVR